MHRKDCRAFRWYDDPRPWRWIHSADPHVGISSGVPVSTPTLPLPIGQPIYPTRLLTAREGNKSTAQYLFDVLTTSTVICELKRLQCRKVHVSLV